MKHRRGSMLVELSVAGVLLGAILTMTVESLFLVARQHEETLRRTVAQQVVANLLERTAELTFRELSAEKGQELAREMPLPELLADGQLALHVETDAGDARAKKVTAELVDPANVGARRPLARLVTWVYASDPPTGGPTGETP